MLISIANLETGEVVDCYNHVVDGNDLRNAKILKIIRGVIRKWLNDGMELKDFQVLKASPDMHFYLREYVVGLQVHQCDVCGNEFQNKDLHYVEDSEGVTVLVLCDDCCGNH